MSHPADAGDPPVAPTPLTDEAEVEERTLLDTVAPVIRRWRLFVFVPPLTALAAFGVTYLVEPTFTAETTFLVPAQSQTSATSAIATLNALSGAVAGAGAGARNPAEQYASLLQSRWVADKLIDRFGLLEVYRVKYRFEARAGLDKRTRIVVGRRDGLVTVTYEDTSPTRAAELANRYVEELRSLSGELALTEAQQRRAFFQRELDRAREHLSAAQRALQSTGFSERTLRAEPKSAAEGYARARAEVTAAEIRLAALRSSMTDSASEVQQQRAVLEAARSQLSRAERALTPSAEAGYLDRYREFKYQEGLVEFLTRQQESARLDESREGAMIQVVDAATVPEWKSKPKRLLVASIALLAAVVALPLLILAHMHWPAFAAGVRAAHRTTTPDS